MAVFDAAEIFFVALAIACSLVASETCLEAASRIGNLTTEINEPTGLWFYYKTNDAQYSCLTFYYTTSDLHGSRVGRVVMRHRNYPAFIMAQHIVVLVPSRNNAYTSIQKSTGLVKTYYRLRPDLSVVNRHFWCSFSCENDGIYVDDFHCFIDNEDIKPSVDQEIFDARLPFRPGFNIINVSEECTASDDTEEL